MRSDVGSFGIMMWEVMNSIGRALEADHYCLPSFESCRPLAPLLSHITDVAPYATISYAEVLIGGQILQP